MEEELSERLFSYGTLQMERVQKETFGRLLDGTKDTLVGYILTEIKIRDAGVIEKSGTDIHPILRFSGNESDKVQGTIFKITPMELAEADKYEVEEYKRTQVRFRSGTLAWVYIDAKQ